MTLSELQVCLAVAAILMGLLLPAVQKVRAASQRVSCLSNLRQLGLAAHNYEQAHGSIPLGICNTTSRCFSGQARLLPFLEQAAISGGIDWTDKSLDFPGQPAYANAANRSLLTQTVSIFLCPADSFASAGAISYRQSLGRNIMMGGNDPLPAFFLAMTDGTSQTALFSERVVSNSAEPSRNSILVDSAPERLGPACIQAQLSPLEGVAEDHYPGSTWLRGSDRHARYAHLLPPNSRLRDCSCSGWVDMSMMAARSNHGGGVNLAFADGHAIFVGDDVDLAIWRAWGSPNGGEVVP